MSERSVDYPVCLKLAGRDVVVVGGGVVAEGRVIALVEAGADVTVVAPRVTDAIADLARSARLRWEQREGDEADVDGRALVFVATDDATVSERIAHASRAARVLVNTADVPHLCDFNLPSVGRRGPLTVAVSSNGQAPALSASLRRSLMEHVTGRHLEIVRLLTFLRTRLPAGPARMKTLKGVVDGDVGALLLAGRRHEAFARVRRVVASHLAATEQAANPTTPQTTPQTTNHASTPEHA